MARHSSLMERTEQHAASVLDSLDFGLLAVDENKAIIFVNRVAEGILKLTRDEMLGTPLVDVLRTPRHSKWLVYDPDRVETEQYQRLRRVKDGGRIAIKSRSIPIRDNEGDVVGSAAVFSEATDFSEVELESNRDRLVSLGELSASVAHEIRNPLTGIRTTIQFVQSKIGEKGKYHGELSDVILELDRIDQIITELLLFGRPQPVRSAPIDVNGLIEKTVESLSNRLLEGNIAVKRAYMEGLPPVNGDTDLLGQVLFNLISNSLQSMPDGGEIRLATSVRRAASGKRRVNIFVSDIGTGISKEVEEKIFDPFFTTRSMGTGLGLPISRQIVRAHGGTLTFRNRRAGGATFRVGLLAEGIEEKGA